MEEKIKEIIENEMDCLITDVDFVIKKEGSLQALVNMLEVAINYTRCCTELKDKYPQAFEEFAEIKAKKQQVEAIYWYNDKSYWTKEHLYKWWKENKENL